VPSFNHDMADEILRGTIQSICIVRWTGTLQAASDDAEFLDNFGTWNVQLL
jgi:hypothetical protein